MPRETSPHEVDCLPRYSGCPSTMARLTRPRHHEPAFASAFSMRLQPSCSSATSSLTRSSWLSATPSSRRSFLLRKRQAPPRSTVVCNGNRNWNRFQTEASRALQRTGRFLQTSAGQGLLWGGLIWLVLTGRAGWIFDSFLYLLLFFSVVPIVGILVLRWWVNRQLVQGNCPSCGAPVSGLKNQSFQCMNCGAVISGETLGKKETGGFSVNDPAGATIDIDAKRID